MTWRLVAAGVGLVAKRGVAVFPNTLPPSGFTRHSEHPCEQLRPAVKREGAVLVRQSGLVTACIWQRRHRRR